MLAYASCPSCRNSIGELLAELMGEPPAKMSAVAGAGMRSTGFGATSFDMAADVAPPRYGKRTLLGTSLLVAIIAGIAIGALVVVIRTGSS